MNIDIITLRTHYRPFVVGGYVLLLGVLIPLFLKSQKNILSVYDTATKAIDKILYKTSLIVHQRLHNIHNPEKTLQMLYEHKKNILTHKHPSFVRGLKLIQKDVKYIEQTLNITYIKDPEREQVFTQRTKVLNKYRRYRILATLVHVLSLGITFIFGKRLYV